MQADRPVVGVAACLVGAKVRYNGQSKRQHQHIEKLKQHTDLRPFCPEVAIGMGVPREVVRLVGEPGAERLMDSASQTVDYSSPMERYAADVIAGNEDLAGYLLVRGSPSCGLERVKRYNHEGALLLNDAVGLFTAAMKKLDPLLPLEEDGRLHDNRLRENFISRVYAYHDWKMFRQEPLSHHGLLQLWTRYKYLVMAHHLPSYKAIGQLLANGKISPTERVAEEFITLLMQGMTRLATRGTHTNVLQHLRGYLKSNLESADKIEMDALIAQYRGGTVPLVVPLTLLRHHFRRFNHSYIDRQVYLSPYPDQLSLRNMI